MSEREREKERENAAIGEVDVVDDAKEKVADVVEVEEDGKVDDVVVLLFVEDIVNRVYVEV